jgi:hypothetical protein
MFEKRDSKKGGRSGEMEKLVLGVQGLSKE